MRQAPRSGLRRLASGFWRWYERHYTLHVGITAFLFLSQIIHLAWLAGDVVILRITGVSFFPVSPFAQFLLALVDYLEIPALASATLLYVHEFRATRSVYSIGLLILIQSQWFHLFWITDEFVVSTIRGAASVSSGLPNLLVWVAIIIDYLELPVIVSTLRRFSTRVTAYGPVRLAVEFVKPEGAERGSARSHGSKYLWSILVVLAIVVVGTVFFVRTPRAPIAQRTPIVASPPSAAALEIGTMTVSNTTLIVEFARTGEEQRRGLMDRDVLPEDRGMLFLFRDTQPRVFWMKHTRIPLDMLWIRSGIVVGITANVRPEPGVADDDLRRYPSPGPADWVIEVNAGWTERHGTRVGDSVKL